MRLALNARPHATWAATAASAGTQPPAAAADSGPPLLPAGVVLVHCYAGVSRSASVVIGYLMWKRGWGFQRAYDHVRKARPCISPNYGFKMQLQQFEELGCDLSKWEAHRKELYGVYAAGQL